VRLRPQVIDSMQRHHQRLGRRLISGGELLESRLLLTADPSPMAQEQLENLNRMRIDPQGELEVFFSDVQNGVARDFETQRALDHFNVDIDLLLSQWVPLSPVAPLIWNESLANAAAFHNEAMVREDAQEHQVDGEPDLKGRVEAQDYVFKKVTENIYAFAENMFHGHAGFALDWDDSPGGIQDPAGHRVNIMDPEVVEVGIDVRQENDDTTDVGPFLITQDFGDPTTWDGPYIVGVVYEDGIDNGRYDVGEGFGNVEVEIVDQDGNSTIVATMSAGGYQVRVDPGTYDVRVSGVLFPLDLVVPNVVVAAENVKVDFERSSGLVPPNANSDSFTIDEDQVTLLDILENDQMIQSAIDPTTVVITQAPDHGGAFVNTVSGDVSYSPVSNFSGTDTFTYRVRDVNGALSEETTVSITIDSVNDLPVGTDLTASVAEDGSVVIQLDGLVSDIDSSVDWNTLRVFDDPAEGSVSTNLANRTATYEPDSEFSGSDSFTYRVADTNGDFSSPNTITINVAAANDPPTAEDDLFGVVEGTTKSLLVLNNDQDPDGDLSYDDIEILSGPLEGEAVVVTGQLNYSPDPGFVGEDTLTYRVSDSLGTFSNPATVTVLVSEAERPWRNPVNPLDVDGSGDVTPFDALLVINFVGLEGLNANTVLPGFEDAPPPFIDVNGSNDVTPFDALLVINELDAQNNSTSPSPASALSTAILAVAKLEESFSSQVDALAFGSLGRLGFPLAVGQIARSVAGESSKSTSHPPRESTPQANAAVDSTMAEIELSGTQMNRFARRLRASVFGDSRDSTSPASVELESVLDEIARDVTASSDDS